MLVLLFLFAVSFTTSVVIGRFVIQLLVAKWEESVAKWMGLAGVRALFYTPTIVAGGHGIGLLPTVFAVFFAEQRYLAWTILPGIIVFIVSMFLSANKNTL